MPPPAPNRALEDALLVAGFAPGGGEAGIRGGRSLFGLEVVEADTDRDGYAFSGDDAFAISQGYREMADNLDGYRRRQMHGVVQDLEAKARNLIRKLDDPPSKSE